jgi:CRISPR-associated protein Csm3
MSVTRLIEIRRITGILRVETGLHIGGSQETMEISGLDNPIIRNPANAEPYIPGSSLKGRMRSLAEWYFDEVPAGGDVTKPDPCSRTGRVFGLPAKEPSKINDPDEKAAYERGPTRLVVRDAHLADSSREAFKAGAPLTEIKSENSIDRLSSMANPRPMERVLPGVEFDLEMVYRVFDVDGDGGKADRNLFDEVVLTALALVEADALGGGGSRGNGKVSFKLKVDGQERALPELIFASAEETAA